MNIRGVEGNLVDSKEDHNGGLPLCLLLYFAPASTGVYPPAKMQRLSCFNSICVHSGYRTVGEYGEFCWRGSVSIRHHVVHSWFIRFLGHGLVEKFSGFCGTQTYDGDNVKQSFFYFYYHNVFHMLMTVSCV